MIYLLNLGLILKDDVSSGLNWQCSAGCDAVMYLNIVLSLTDWTAMHGNHSLDGVQACRSGFTRRNTLLLFWILNFWLHLFSFSFFFVTFPEMLWQNAFWWFASGGDLIVKKKKERKKKFRLKTPVWPSVILSVVTDDCVKNSKYVYIFYYIIAVVLCRSILYRKFKFLLVLLTPPLVQKDHLIWFYCCSNMTKAFYSVARNAWRWEQQQKDVHRNIC